VGGDVEIPSDEDILFIGRTIQIIFCPSIQVDGFFDIIIYFIPNCSPLKVGGLEYTTIPFFPQFPHDETWYVLSNMIEYR
jgi:hypothetical protein